MKKTIKLMTLVLLLAVMTVSCKKYPEGPSMSLRSKKSRVAGDWTIESVKFNNNDVTSAYVALVPGFKMTMTKEGNYTVTSNSGELDTGTWKFDDKKENIISTSTKNKNSSGAYESSTVAVLKLENDAMWVKQTSGNGDITETHYKQ
jgi:hypothetical protein